MRKINNPTPDVTDMQAALVNAGPVITGVRPVDQHLRLTDSMMMALHTALTRRRGDGTEEEQAYAAHLLRSLVFYSMPRIDSHGNIIVDLREGPQHRTMFTSHTDTVAHKTGDNPIVECEVDGVTCWMSDGADVLGADCGAGVALMVHMILLGIKGLYVFFRGEECGGTGSTGMARDRDVLAGIDRCISFDRAGYHDVITHQAGGRCCSDEFALALAEALTTDDMTLCFAPDSTGVFTDSANLTEIVAECTNISVGYFDQHTTRERLDIGWLQALAQQLTHVQWDALPVVRDPRVQESMFAGTGTYMTKWATEKEQLVDAMDEACAGNTMALVEAVYDQLGIELEFPNMYAVTEQALRIVADGLYENHMLLDVALERILQLAQEDARAEYKEDDRASLH